MPTRWRTPDRLRIPFLWAVLRFRKYPGLEVNVLLGPDAAVTISLTETEKLQVTNNGAVPVSGDFAGEEFSLPGGEELIVNRPPEVDVLAGPVAGVRGQTLSFTGSFTDPDPQDTHTATWDVTDGSGRIVASGSGTSLRFTPTVADTYTVGFTVTDDSGAADTAAVDATASVVLLTPDPSDPTQQVLWVGGSMGRDKIDLKQGRGHGTVEVKIHEKTNKIKFEDGFGPGVDRIVVFAQDGDDDVRVHESLGPIPTALFGGPGTDRLEGGPGRDLLFGGPGADDLEGNGEDDILVAAASSIDADLLLLDSILDQWNAETDYQTRVAAVRNSGLQAALTVFDDGAKDRLAGRSGRDWFFADLEGANADELKGLQYDELIELLG